ncbi:hypothetical protein RUM44_010433 [Polyplax serrata]|uniref:Uncharacterized protein n=1 Tax=Polyplax serrata TaxID=468196 RepID=A0ABR1AW66_POLSC
MNNPSYFTIPGGATPSTGNRHGRFSLIRKHVRLGAASSTGLANSTPSNKIKKGERYSVLPTSSCAMSPSVSASATTLASECSTPSIESNFRRSFRSLMQANNFDNPIETQMFVLGMPRPSDIAPSVQQVPHSIRKHHNRNASTGKPYRIPSSDILSSFRSPKTLERSPELTTPEVGRVVDDRYYNAMPGANFVHTGRRHSIGAYFNKKNSSVSRTEAPQIEEETSFTTETPKVDFKFTDSTPSCVKKKESTTSRKRMCCCKAKQEALQQLFTSH